MALEQFKNSIPQRIAIHVAEQKATTLLRAVELADDFALTHSDICSGGDVRCMASSYGNLSYGNQSPAAGTLLTFKNSRGRDDSSKVCNYCQEPGHWKDQCLILRSKGRQKPFLPAPAPALSCSSVAGLQPGCVELGCDSGFEPFITSAVLSLVDSNERVRI